MLAVIAQLLVSGIATGFIYGLTAIQYTLIWNSCGLLNFAHTKTIMFSAYVFVGTFLAIMAKAYFPAVICTILLVALFGVLIACVIFIPLRNFTRIIAVMATVMLGTLLNESAVLIYGSAPMSSMGFLDGKVEIGGMVTSLANIYIIAISLLVSIALRLFTLKTKPGRAMTCVAQDKTAAALMGVEVKKSMALSVAISFGICGLLGCLTAPLFKVQQTMVDMVGLKGFAAGVIGGFGNTAGALLGGLLLGVVENLACMVVPSTYKDVIAFALLIVFLMLKPGGLISQKKD